MNHFRKNKMKLDMLVISGPSLYFGFSLSLFLLIALACITYTQ